MKKTIIVMAMALCIVAGSTEAGFAATETADYQHSKGTDHDNSDDSLSVS